LAMSSTNPGPLCPRCRRRVAAWRLDHCIYCGERFPDGFREGYEEPAALQWVERPTIPPEATKQLEMMKVVSFDKEPKSRSLTTVFGLLSLPVFAVIFYLLYGMVARTSSASAVLVVVAVRVIVFVVLGAIVPNVHVSVWPPATGEFGKQNPAFVPLTVQLSPAGNTSLSTTLVELPGPLAVTAML